MYIIIKELVYYVYAYLREDGTPYYIGKGKNKRVSHSKRDAIQPPRDKSRIVFLETHLTEIGALAIEARMIRWYGRKDLSTGILMNKSNGGEGSSGFKHTEEAKAASRASNRVTWAKLETIERHNKSMQSVWSNPERNAAISKATIGENNARHGIKMTQAEIDHRQSVFDKTVQKRFEFKISSNIENYFELHNPVFNTDTSQILKYGSKEKLFQTYLYNSK